MATGTEKVVLSLDAESGNNKCLQDIKSEPNIVQGYDLKDPDAGLSEQEILRNDRRLLLKIDLWLIPWLCFIYLLSFLDRTNIGNARLVGLENDLLMSGGDFNMTLTIFFISYAVFEPLTNIILKRTTPRYFFTVILFGWGVCMTCMGLVHNYAGLLATRFFLGLMEAGLFPAVTFYLSCWYKRSEIGLRIALFFSAAAIAGSFGGLLAAALARMDGVGGKPGWAWIFIIEGLVTVIASVACYWMIFDWPTDTRSFLKEDDRQRVQRRILADRQASTTETFDRRYVYAALKDWKTYVFAWINAGCLVPVYGFSLFLPTILRGLGHSGTRAQLLSVPPYAVAAVVTVAVGWCADRSHLRGPFNIGCCSIGIVGFCMLLGSANARVQYAGTFLAALGIYPTIPNTISWISNNTDGVYKRGIVMGISIGWSNLNGIVSTNVYLSRESPRFWTGHSVLLGYLVLGSLTGSITMHMLLKAENKKKMAGKRDHLVEDKTVEEIRIIGDKRPDFVYIV
ncbi:hypothetical protein B0A52_02153 [Exophiala mesophila]|uniref:Major facilitator superfamily (MFS) profile domain-containing protein n=1 Tax=Exophiala mesophila TaxID=212818 RepID=A0A438NBP6_EXOME|nr:hypothetical protein B0A52_02153 [Exophiala mesophila]